MTANAAAAAHTSEQIRWGILATGGVAHLFVKDLLAHGHRVDAVGSRSFESAASFAAIHGIPTAYGSYEELAEDPDLDVIYVATPHNLHAANAMLALKNGKHVLVEKTFTLTQSEAREVTTFAAQQRLLVMEAMWTRFLPHMHYVRDLVRSRRIGDVRSLHAEHAQLLPADPGHRINNPLLAGGALLDLGIYPISFAADMLGPAEEVLAQATFKPSGVDGSVATIMRHAAGAISTTYSSSEVAGFNGATILGTEGRIEIAHVWYMPTTVTLYDARGAVAGQFDGAVSGRGMQYQAAEVEHLIRAGQIESSLMSSADSVNVMATMDEVRRSVGLRYPNE